MKKYEIWIGKTTKKNSFRRELLLYVEGKAFIPKLVIKLLRKFKN